MDEVIRRSGMPASAVSVALLSLEMKRLISNCRESFSCETSSRQFRLVSESLLLQHLRHR